MEQRTLAGTLVLALICAGAVGGVTAGGATTDGTPGASTASDPHRVDSNANAAESVDEGVGELQADCNYTELSEAVENSVVTLNVSNPTHWWAGSGWVYRIDDSTAYVVTNHHVVDNGTDIDVQFGEGRWRDASVVGSDPVTDLAVVRVENPPEATRALPVADDLPRRGQPVALVGTPLQQDWELSMTRGIVSGVNRSGTVSASDGTNRTHFDLVQTDAAANPGNSGGPLLDCRGRVVGVLNSGVGGFDSGINFAVSSRTVREVVPALVEDGRYDHSYLGVSVANVGPNVAEANDLDVTTGVMVTYVQPGSPADGRLREAPAFHLEEGVPYDGDVILAVDGVRIDDKEDLGSYLLLETRPGDAVNLTVLRDGENRTVTATLATRPSPPTPNATTTTPGPTPETTETTTATPAPEPPRNETTPEL